ncbi:MAG: AtpZ/AtpI family protein [Microthrixaceae bacterium]|nr:AtpZ/AtpI family protein [Microthrixaceae bacterium]MCB1011263.1 AtpZ/AtpI family protein [Microthrixaceae bacterium]MCB9387916.1 AtpZ/AtpI family protein [Microthrixaceae bacterium]MCO5321829.1 AtpZ/AtpI family protein [Microthrixaceae bacterium]
MTTENSPTTLTDAAHRSSGSFELVLGPVMMALLGLLLDGVFGTKPVLTIVFTVWGALGATVAIYYRYRHQVATVSTARDGGSAPMGRRP